MRKRVRGKYTYYYFDTGAFPRKEKSLGSDYFSALRQYADLTCVSELTTNVTFSDVIHRYLIEELPKLAENTRHTHSSDIKHVKAFFGTAPIDQIRPMHIRQFLNRHKNKPTTANRCKRLFSTIWNHARGWGYTDLQNPCEGIKGYALDKRTVYITDAVFEAVYDGASAPLRDAMDLAYLTGQRPADALLMTERDIIDGHLIITQMKTKQPLRIIIRGQLAELIERIRARKKALKAASSALLVNSYGKRLTAPALRNQFTVARRAAAKANPALAAAINQFWFYDLRAKAADDTSDDRGDQAASDLLGHESVRTTQRHYLRRGKIVTPTK